MKEKIKEISNKFFKNGRGALLVLFILEIILTMFITPSTYDDAWFIEQITDKLDPATNQVIEHSIPNFIEGRYNNWSSRVIIEFVLCSVLKTSKYLWIVVEALMVVLVGYSISKIFVKDNKNQNNLILIAMILIYPYNIMHQTGWASTTINYMWPLATGLFALIPIKKIWDGEKISWWQYPLYSIALVFAANQEQAGALLLGFYLVFTLLMIIRKDKKLNLYIIIQLLISLLSVIFILTCPGNEVRQYEELYRFVDYQMLSVLDKFVLGFTSTFGRIIDSKSTVYLLLTGLIAFYICSNYKEKLYRVVSLIPVLSILIFGTFLPILNVTFPYLNEFKELLVHKDVVLTVENCNNVYNAFPIIFSFANFICIGMSLLLIFKNLKNNVAILIFLAGLASRIILAFSPTVFVSKTRTMIFFDFAMIIISYLVFDKIKEKEEGSRKLKILTTIINYTALIQYINVLIYIYSNQKLY